MSKSDVLRAIRRRIPLPRRVGDEWTWTARGFVRLNELQTYDTWTATLSFRNGRVEEIDVSCERGS